MPETARTSAEIRDALHDALVSALTDFKYADLPSSDDQRRGLLLILWENI